MAHFFCRLTPPRKTFIMDMTPAERELMGRHGAYWQAGLECGNVIAYGPVADPQGGFGMGVLSFPDQRSAEEFCAQDPVILAGAGFRTELWPMPVLVHR